MNSLSAITNCASVSPESEEDLEAIATEYAELLESGESISPEIFAARFANHGPRLLELLKSIRWIQLAARDLDDSKNTDRSASVGRSTIPKLPRMLSIDPDNPVCLGDYRLIREVGRGGMGIVYEAQQISLSRRVAVKILPPSVTLDQRHIARFTMESQAAAQLLHPNIVPVITVGYEAGVYFYSMPLIEGSVPNGPMQPDQVALLGISVANALEHSHELGIIHRDIKPTNLIVDESGKVWVTDFGLARFRQGEQATASGAVLGTLRYMSPEQASGSALVDHRSDIYSLGVTLYELLTGRCPFDASNRSALLIELSRGEPVGIRQLDSSIPVDLETIVHKAMSNEPHLRYPTAQALADDLTRFVHGEVIHARRPTLLDRLSKWVTRNRRWVAAAVAMWSLTSVLAVFAAIMLLRAENETSAALQKTRKSLDEADVYFSQAREVVDHFGITLSKQLAEISGAETTRRELLRDTLRYYRNFMSQAESNPLRQREVALTYMKIGRVAEQMEAVDEAVEAYNRSEQIWQSIGPNDPDRALCANLLGLLLARLGKSSQADEAFQVAIDCNQSILTASPTDWETQRRLALTLTNRIASRPISEEQTDGASLKTALAIHQKLLANPELEARMKAELLVDCGKACGALAAICRSIDPKQSQSYSKQCIDCFEEAMRCNGESLQFAEQSQVVQDAAHDLVVALCNHASILHDEGEVSQAVGCAIRAIEQGTAMCKQSSKPSCHTNLAAAYNSLARLYGSQKKPTQQLEAFLKASSILAGLVEQHSNQPAFRLDLALVSYNLQKVAEQLSQSSVASRAQAELQVQHQWLREQAPSHANQLTELIKSRYSEQGQL